MAKQISKIKDILLMAWWKDVWSMKIKLNKDEMKFKDFWYNNCLYRLPVKVNKQNLLKKKKKKKNGE